MFVWEHPYWPAWFVPVEDLAAELRPSDDQTPSRTALPGAVRYDLLVGGSVLPGAARGYPDSDELRDLVTVRWSALDRWYEEDEEVFVHPRSPYTRVDTIASSRHVVVRVGHTVVADSRRPVALFETGLPVRYYLPVDDVRFDLLSESETLTSCPYKGDAHHYDVVIEGAPAGTDLAWQYRDPLPESAGVAGLICFYDEKVDVEIDGIRQERPLTKFG